MNDASAKTPGPVYEKDSAPYYDPTKPQIALPIKREYNIPMQRYTSNIYPLDQKPYYGPNDYRVYTNVPDDRVKVKVNLGDLTEKVASEKNIYKLKQQLDAIQNQYNGPKYLSKDSGEKEVYIKDQRPYYDPTLISRIKKIQHLNNTIADLEAQYNDNSAQPQLNLIKVETHVQNFVNKNKENTNQFIAGSYHYDVNRSTLQKETVYSKGFRVGSPDKYYDRTEQTLVEAEEKGNLKKKL